MIFNNKKVLIKTILLVQSELYTDQFRHFDLLSFYVLLSKIKIIL